MARGKPFTRVVQRVVSSDTSHTPLWLNSIASTKHSFEPITRTVPPPLRYQEDSNLPIHLRRTPYAPRVPFTVKEGSSEGSEIEKRSPAVGTGPLEAGMWELEAHDGAERELNLIADEDHERERLSEGKVENTTSMMFNVSMTESQRDQQLFRDLRGVDGARIREGTTE